MANDMWHNFTGKLYIILVLVITAYKVQLTHVSFMHLMYIPCMYVKSLYDGEKFCTYNLKIYVKTFAYVICHILPSSTLYKYFMLELLRLRKTTKLFSLERMSAHEVPIYLTLKLNSTCIIIGEENEKPA